MKKCSMQAIDLVDDDNSYEIETDNVRFNFEDGSWIEIHFTKDNDSITVRGKKSIQIQPVASNTIRVTNEET